MTLDGTYLQEAHFHGPPDVRNGKAYDLTAYFNYLLNDQFTLTPYALWTFAPHLRLSGYGIVGFTNSSPDIGGGVRLIFFQS